MNKSYIFGLLAILLTLSGCEHETYETGEGSLSLTTTDFGMMHSSEAQRADYVVTDDGRRLNFAIPAIAEWATTADSLYRVLAYYKVEADSSIQPVSMNQVIVAPLYETVQLKAVPTDPLTFTSAWAGGGYLNVGFSVNTGKQDGDMQTQRIGFARDSIRIIDGKRVSFIRMMHEQNGQPEDYSVRSSASVPWPEKCDSIVLSVNDYKNAIIKGIPSER